MIRNLKNYLVFYRTYTALSQLPDKTLRDIGYERGNLYESLREYMNRKS